MQNYIKSIKDLIVIKAQDELCNLSDNAKLEFLDEVQKNKKGILVTFNLSSSARLINGRIYTPKGQRAGLNSWVQPYKKPILFQHDREKDPLGRIISVEYVDNEREALPFFKSFIEFNKFKAALENDDYDTIYGLMFDNNLIGNPKWPGMGHLVAKARITDEAAIKKFLDERYLTFSAGSHTDKFVCSSCHSDWAKTGGPGCDHKIGGCDEDGKPIVFITGIFMGDEASIVNKPANTLSKVYSIEFSDAADMRDFDIEKVCIQEANLEFVDSETTTGDLMEESEIKDFEQKLLGSVTQLLSDFKKEFLATLPTKAEDASEKVTLASVKEIDWYLLDAALSVEAGERSFDKDTCDEKFFCGPNKTFAVNDEHSRSAALAVLAKTSLSDKLKEKIITSIEDKVKFFPPVVQPCLICKNMQKDYETALLQIQDLQKELETIKNSASLLDSQQDTGENKNNTELPVIGTVSNPSISGQDSVRINKQLGDFEKTIVDRYLQIKQQQGLASADVFLSRKKAAGHLPINFNIKNFIRENN